jgi:hypothetical protein
MIELLLQMFWAKNPCKKSADLHPRQGNLLHWNIFTGLNKTSLCFTSVGLFPGRSFHTLQVRVLSFSRTGVRRQFLKESRGRFFVHFFRGKFRGKFSSQKCWEKLKFSQEKSFKKSFPPTNSTEFSAENNARKIGPRRELVPRRQLKWPPTLSRHKNFSRRQLRA